MADARRDLNGVANRIVFEQNPTAGSPRNSEGAFVTLAGGRMLFAYSAFYGGGGDDAAARIAGRWSDDGGLTWSDPPETVVENEGQQNVMGVSLLRLSDGSIALFYAVKNGFHDCRLHWRTSTDEATTWSDPRRVIDAPGYFVVNNDRVVQLRTGRLVVPAALHRCTSDRVTEWRSFDSRGIAMWFLSDDRGATWRETRTWWALPVASSSGLQEPGVVELADGRLFSWCRTSVGCQYGLWSDDGGETWSAPVPTDLRSPCSPASIKRMPRTGDLLLVYNDHSDRSGVAAPHPGSSNRTPLVTAISRDEARTWQGHRLLEASPTHGFCYTAIHVVDDAVLLAYCAGGEETDGVLNRLRIRRVSLDWVYGGEA